MENEELKRRITALEKWKEEKTLQQISFPLDFQSLTILNKYFLSNIGNLNFTSATGTPFNNILVQQDNRINVVSVYTSLVRYTASVSTNELTIGQDIVNLSQGSFANDDQILVMSTDTPPSPLVDNVPYYVVNASAGGTIIQLSNTLGGAAIDITTVGVGQQFIRNAL